MGIHKWRGVRDRSNVKCVKLQPRKTQWSHTCSWGGRSWPRWPRPSPGMQGPARATRATPPLPWTWTWMHLCLCVCQTTNLCVWPHGMTRNARTLHYKWQCGSSFTLVTTLDFTNCCPQIWFLRFTCLFWTWKLFSWFVEITKSSYILLVQGEDFS